MKKLTSLAYFLLATTFLSCSVAYAQSPSTLHVVKSDINAESENAELCLEFDKALASSSPAHLASALDLQADGKNITPQNIAATGTSLCLFPLERGKSYHLNVVGLHGEGDTKMTNPYSQSFTIPDRSPALAFTGKNGGVNGFSSYDSPLTLRAVNVGSVKLEVYRVTDISAMAHAWQDRAQTALAPSESAYLARSKGQQVWQTENAFDALPNATAEQSLSLHDKMPDLTPGLYLLIADAGNEKENTKPASKGLTPLAATWFTKSDFTIRAVRDVDGIYAFATQKDATKPKIDIHLSTMNKKPEVIADMQGSSTGISLISYPQNMADKTDIATVVATDSIGNVAFADIESLPVLASTPALGTLYTDGLFAVPGSTVAVYLSLIPSENTVPLTEPSLLHVGRSTFTYGDFPVPILTEQNTTTSFPAPAVQGGWKLRWQKNDGTVLADTKLRVTTNADMPHLEVTSDRDVLTSDGIWPLEIKSRTSTGQPTPLVGGHITIAWQKLDPDAFGWKDYRFGTQAAILDAATPIADFLTDLQGETSLHLALPARPPEPGLYQAVLKVRADNDSGIAEATPLIVPLRPDATVIGIKPLSTDARFTQNGIARFALIGLSSDGKPRDVSGLSYQVYEEGRNFDWYQDEGRWKYKPEPQLRPIGGGGLTIKADKESFLEWPVTAGNYRLEILDPNGKILAQTPFSAGWDSSGAMGAPAIPLNILLPKTLQPGVETTAHVDLPGPAMLTALIADTRIRKTIHELRPKGDNTILFTPGPDWQQGISLTVEAMPQDGPTLRGVSEAAIAQNKPAPLESAGAAIVTTDEPAGLALHKGDFATLDIGIENKGDMADTYLYTFTTSAGLKIESGTKGSILLPGHQSRSISLSFSGDQPGSKELRLDITDNHALRLNHIWTMEVLPKTDTLGSTATYAVEAGKPLFPNLKSHTTNEELFAFVSRRQMNGLVEILSAMHNAQPFTTTELALNIDALRLWGETMAQIGLAPASLISAQQNEQLIHLLNHQNVDGGFAPYRGSESTMEDTSAALTALGANSSALAQPAKDLAIIWIKQQLSNTWYDDKERDSRASAYAALAAADAIDPASLHYFSDTSATSTLSAIADAHIAAAFKHIHEPNAAAFWIKKMLDETPRDTSIPLLNALAATDALSSDDVHAVMENMADHLHRGDAASLTDVSALLRAISSDNTDAGKWRLVNGSDIHDSSGVIGLHLSDTAAATYHNDNDRSLSVTLVATTKDTKTAPPTSGSVTRHIYRLNGVELSPTTKTAHGEIYIVELKGTAVTTVGDQHILLQDSADTALRPIGCPLSNKLDTPSFMPWFSTHDLITLQGCEFSSHSLNILLAPNEDDKDDFSVVYFAHIDTPSISDMPPARLRVLK